MEATKIIEALKNICAKDIVRYKKKVKDDEENTYTNGVLGATECFLQTILNYEELRDFSNGSKKQSN